MERMELGFDDKVITNIFSKKTTKRKRGSKTIIVEISKSQKEIKEGMDEFYRKLNPNSTLRNKINRMVDFQDDF